MDEDALLDSTAARGDLSSFESSSSSLLSLSSNSMTLFSVPDPLSLSSLSRRSTTEAEDDVLPDGAVRRCSREKGVNSTKGKTTHLDAASSSPDESSILVRRGIVFLE